MYMYSCIMAIEHYKMYLETESLQLATPQQELTSSRIYPNSKMVESVCKKEKTRIYTE